MHIDLAPVDIQAVSNDEPVKVSSSLSAVSWLCVTVGIITFGVGLLSSQVALTWASFYTSLIFFMGLACGSIIITAIAQIVRATWSGPLRRLLDANVGFLPIAYTCLLITYFGKEYLFPWANEPMPGREWWMQPNFVYGRFAVLFALLFILLWRFVRVTLRNDIGLVRSRSTNKKKWSGWFYDCVTNGWQGADREILPSNRRLSIFAPALIFIYAVVYTLFSFEMIIGMDKSWVSNLFPAFMFVGNIYMGWVVVTMSLYYFSGRSAGLNRIITKQQYWDAGKLTFGFCMIWGYFFFSQFLPQWYGNLPEETQWLITRTRDFPWKGLGWFVFTACFVFPWIVLLGREIKRTPSVLTTVGLIILIGIWCEMYLLVVPNLSPDRIPFNVSDVGIFLGFFGAYILSINCFLSKIPYVAVSHPLTHGSVDW